MWRGTLERVSLNVRVQHILFSAYWALAGTMLGGAIVSLGIISDDLTPFEFTILRALVIGMVAQAALFALVLTPVRMRSRFKNWTFSRSLVIMECVIVIPSVVMAAALLWMVCNPEIVRAIFSR
jgi:hypothetical protein